MSSSSLPPLSTEQIMGILRSMRAVQADRLARIFRYLRILHQHPGVRDNPALVIGSRPQGFYLIPEVKELISLGLQFRNDANSHDMVAFHKLLADRGIAIVELQRTHYTQLQLHTRKGRITIG